MIGNLLDKLFRLIYSTMKLNFMFLLTVMMGGIVFGVGPAFLNISDLYVSYKFNHEKMHFSELHQMFLKNFKRGNQLFYSYGLVMFFIVYNLFLSFQIKNGLILFLQIIMIFGITFLGISYLYANVINSYYDIEFFDLVKLSTLSFFANIMQLIRFFISLVGVYFIYKLMPGLLLFAVFGLLVIVSVESLRDWVKIIEETIDYL